MRNGFETILTLVSENNYSSAQRLWQYQVSMDISSCCVREEEVWSKEQSSGFQQIWSNEDLRKREEVWSKNGWIPAEQGLMEDSELLTQTTKGLVWLSFDLVELDGE
ncbi:hypothetical protein CEXT_3701 [Caerostris extrusa]|uniref:Uncharacterized protein n=1 Tax=Caerostris extrusa TaxID=172846 RepID=A0AAV4VVN6_CAEEX|nr:hypothetical protein CEXT_3701 [Caerostris extrusa]